MNVNKALLAMAVALFSGPLPVFGTVYRVGPNESIRRPSELTGRVVAGDVVEILPGTYLDDEAVWRTDRLTLRGVGEKPRLHVSKDYRIANGKAIWVIAGDRIRIENLEFSGAHVPALNGAGLRVEGSDLTVDNCYFHENEFGILSGKTGGTLTVTNSEFAYQHRTGRFAHGIYVGDAEQFVFQGNYVHHSDGGHHVKSRARKSRILYNFLSDGEGGRGSYAIDLANCGHAVIMGNVLLQGEHSVNHTAISYGAEGCAGKPVSLAVVNNSYVNLYPNGGYFVKNHSDRTVLIANNVTLGSGALVQGPAKTLANLKRGSCSGSGSKVIRCLSAGDRHEGVSLPASLTPVYQYSHPANSVPRPAAGKTVIGAFGPSAGQN